jgi:hypothetical protein
MLETRRRLLKPICTSCADYVDVYWLHLWDKFTPIEENDFKMLMIATLVAIPLLIVFKKASDDGGKNHTLVVD